MENVYVTGNLLLKQGHCFAYATIIAQDGSTPRGVGSKMLVLPDRIEATIGGGLMEAQVMERARREVLMTGKTQRMTFDLSGEDAAKTEFICGGRCEILICYVDPQNPAHCEVFSEAARLTAEGGMGWLITVLNRENHTAHLCLSLEGKRLLGEYDPGFMIPVEQLLAPSRIAIHGDGNEQIQYLVEAIHTGGTVYLFGAGHVSAGVARITTMLEFHTVVIDDREEFLTAQRFPDCQLLLLDTLENLPSLPVDRDSYVLIITRGHSHDEGVLRWAIGQPAGYIGMIGSTQKRDRIYSNMVADGFPQACLSAVHSPIGLPIGGQTPAEIAVSIAAELVQVRTGAHQ